MFLGRPIAKEIAGYWAERGRIFRRLRIYLWLLIVGGALVAMTLPRDQVLSLPARIAPQAVLTIAMPVTGIVSQLPPQFAHRDAPVLTIEEPERLFLLKQTEARIEFLKLQIERSATGRAQLDQSRILQEELENEQARLAELRTRVDDLTLRVPRDAQFMTDLPVLPREGSILGTGRMLGQYVTTDVWKVTAYLSSADLRHAQALREGVFKPRDPLLPRLDVRVSEVSPSFAAEIGFPELSRIAGGAIETQGAALRPVSSWVQVSGDIVGDLPSVPIALAGTLEIKGERQSLFERAYIQIIRVLRREAVI